MLKILINKIQNFKKFRMDSYASTLESFNDPIAKEIEWCTLNGIRYGYKNRRIIIKGNQNIILIPTIRSLLFDFVFISMGLYVMYKFFPVQFSFDQIIMNPIRTIGHYFFFLPDLIRSEMIWGHLFGLVFLILGIIMLYFSVKPIVFNSQNRTYKKGFLKGNKLSFDEIHAIQLIYNPGNGPDSSSVYDLNLVLKSKTRSYVYCSTDKKSIRKDAEILSKHLSVPIWDFI